MRASISVVCLCGALACRPAAPTKGPAPTLASDPVSTPAPVPEPEPEPEPTPPPRADSYTRLLPPSIQIVLGADIRGLQHTKTWNEAKEDFTAAASEYLEAFETCNLGPETWNAALVGFSESDGPDPTLVMVLSATGVGTPETMACFATENSKREDTDWKPSPDGFGYVGKNAAMLPVDPNAMAVVSPDVAEQVRARIEQGGPSALEGPLRIAATRIDTSQHLWVVGVPPEETELTTGVLLRNFSASVDLTYGIRYFVALGVDDPGAANTTRDFFTSQLDGIAGMTTGLGVPPEVMERVEISVMGNATTISGMATADELEQIQQAIEAMDL
ncbi:MAG: hypothetical protein AAF799_16255 [Myxococcota bacterium]